MLSALCISAALPSKNRPQPVYQIVVSHEQQRVSTKRRSPEKKNQKRHCQRQRYTIITREIEVSGRRKKPTAVEERVTSEDDLVLAVLREPADAVLRVAGRVQALDRDAAELETLAVGGSLGRRLAVPAADDGEVWFA